MNITTTVPKRLNLSVCGSRRFSLGEVRNVETPEAETRLTPKTQIETVSWQPIPHDSLIREFYRQASESGLKVRRSYHALARQGLRYFGLYEVEGINRANSDTGTVIGIRNSHDRAFAASFSAGSAPFVCTNLIFSNEIVLGRKHTRHILNDLPMLVSRALGQLGSHWATQDQREEAYKDYSLTNVEAHDLIIRAFQNGAIGKTQIADVASQWHTPEHDEAFSHRNGWSLYNAFTNVYRGNLPALSKRSDALHGLLDVQFGLNN